MVKRELDLITDSSKVYKLIGSILVPQEIEEARSNVAKRLEYINREE
jgi:prefoldin beta subunit